MRGASVQSGAGRDMTKCAKCDDTGLLHPRHWGRGDIACDCKQGRALRREYAALYARWERESERKTEKAGV